MKRALSPCPVCRRHVRTGDPACPFCAAPLDLPAREPVRVTPRLGSLAKITFRVALAGAALTACGGKTTSPTDEPEPETASSGSGGEALGGAASGTGALGGEGGTGGLSDDPVASTGGDVAAGGRRFEEPDPPPTAVVDAGGPVSIYRASP